MGYSRAASRSQWKDQHSLGGIIPIVLIWESCLWDATKCTRWKGELCCSAWTRRDGKIHTDSQLSCHSARPHQSKAAMIQIGRDNRRLGKRWLIWFLSIFSPKGNNMTNQLRETLIWQKLFWKWKMPQDKWICRCTLVCRSDFGGGK